MVFVCHVDVNLCVRVLHVHPDHIDMPSRARLDIVWPRPDQVAMPGFTTSQQGLACISTWFNDYWCVLVSTIAKTWNLDFMNSTSHFVLRRFLVYVEIWHVEFGIFVCHHRYRPCLILMTCLLELYYILLRAIIWYDDISMSSRW